MPIQVDGAKIKSVLLTWDTDDSTGIKLVPAMAWWPSVYLYRARVKSSAADDAGTLSLTDARGVVVWTHTTTTATTGENHIPQYECFSGPPTFKATGITGSTWTIELFFVEH